MNQCIFRQGNFSINKLEILTSDSESYSIATLTLLVLRYFINWFCQKLFACKQPKKMNKFLKKEIQGFKKKSGNTREA